MTRRCEADVLIVGAGPAGLAAAAAAASRGRRVLLVDQGIRAGGQIWRHRDVAELPPLARRMMAQVQTDRVQVLAQARVVDAQGPGSLLVESQGEMIRCEAAATVLCTGARERFLPFPGWTLPGVTGIGGLQALLKSGLTIRGSRVVLAGSGPLLLPVAAAVAQAGGHLALVAEQAPWQTLAAFAAVAFRSPARVMQAIRYRSAFRAPYRVGTWVTRALGTERLSEVELTDGHRRWIEPCEWLGHSVGLVPNTDLARLLGCALAGVGIAVDAEQRTTCEGVWAAGECTGVKGEMAAITEGTMAGAAAAGDASAAGNATLQRARDAGRRFGVSLAQACAPRAELLALPDADTVLCRCEDVPCGAIDPAWTQRQAKLWTRVGMGACQGAVCGPACGALYGWHENQVRPPLGTPTLGAWADAESTE